MSSVVEGMGGAVEGGLLARAVEPGHGEPMHRADAPVAADGHTAESACLNCGTRLAGDFCHRCGQHAHVHRTLGAFGHDLLHGVLHLEGKIWRTLPKLMFRPGELTRRYIAGERARFVSPLALFLFSVFTMFAVMSFFGSPANVLDEARDPEVQTEFRRELGEADGRLQRLRQDRAAASALGADTRALDRRIRGAEQARGIVAGLVSGAETEAGRDAYRAGLEKGRATAPQPARSRDPADAALGEAATNSWFDEAYAKAKRNPGLLAYKLQTNAYKFSWALIIISVPFVALLFLWRWRPLYDHTVFTTYSITAVSILAIVGSLLVLAGVPSGPVWAVASLFLPWHMYRQLRGGYELRRISALWRTVLLLVFAFVAVLLFFFGLLALGVLG